MIQALQKSKERILELDALRGIAALAVVLFHFTVFYYKLNTETYGPLFKFKYGFYGFHLFFIISGFVIFMTLERTRKPMDFLVSRFSRLYPAYWLSILFHVLVLFVAGYTLNAKQILVNFTMLQHWFGVEHLDGVYWTLNVELSFYVVMFLAFITKKLKYIEVFGLIWMTLMILETRLGPFWPSYSTPWVIERSGLFSFGHLFFAGILFYKIYQGEDTWPIRICLFFCWITQLAENHAVYPSGFYIGLFFIGFYAFAKKKMGILRHPVLVFLGAISYSLYLIHQTMGYEIMKVLYLYKMNSALILLIPLGISIGLATIVHVAVEMPSMNWIRSVYRGKKN